MTSFYQNTAHFVLEEEARFRVHVGKTLWQGFIAFLIPNQTFLQCP